jgi:hypothetical protein
MVTVVSISFRLLLLGSTWPTYYGHPCMLAIKARLGRRLKPELGPSISLANSRRFGETFRPTKILQASAMLRASLTDTHSSSLRPRNVQTRYLTEERDYVF